MYRSDLYRDYRTDTGYIVDEPIYEVEHWKEWLFWMCMLKVEIYGPEASMHWVDANDTKPYSISIYPDDHHWFRQGMESNYWAFQMGKWKEEIEFVDVEHERWW
tara:strand:- start:92 stop:403 length:312 start_codon:yes stop_codon:yes gene_type:complete